MKNFTARWAATSTGKCCQREIFEISSSYVKIYQTRLEKVIILKDGKGTKLLLIVEEKEANDENLDTAKNYYIH